MRFVLLFIIWFMSPAMASDNCGIILRFPPKKTQVLQNIRTTLDYLRVDRAYQDVITAAAERCTNRDIAIRAEHELKLQNLGWLRADGHMDPRVCAIFEAERDELQDQLQVLIDRLNPPSLARFKNERLDQQFDAW